MYILCTSHHKVAILTVKMQYILHNVLNCGDRQNIPAPLRYCRACNSRKDIVWFVPV